MTSINAWFASVLLAADLLGHAASPVFVASDTEGTAGRCAAPLSVQVDLANLLSAPSAVNRITVSLMNEPKPGQSALIPAQFEPDTAGSSRGKVWWLMPPGKGARRKFALAERATAGEPVTEARKDSVTGRWDIRDAGKPVLGYNYQTNEPGALLSSIHPDNLKYARARGDYIHPLFGLDGEVLTKDWSVDHPHHRGIYWAWPEVDYRGERGDLHALQRVFARPTGRCVGESGPLFARIEAENLWLWEDKEPIVREVAIIRAWHTGPTGRLIDLEFQFTALKDDVAIARRETKFYGGLNMRFASVKDQRIDLHTDAAEASPRRAWAELFGEFAGGRGPVGLVVFQTPTNPDYPGDWVKYPDLNWLQPTFPAAGKRYVLKKDQPLTLLYRLWIHPGTASEEQLTDGWDVWANPPKVTIEKQ